MTLLTIGPIHALVQNTVYALPARRCLVYTNTASPGLQQSNDSAFATSSSISLTNGQGEAAGTFIRSTAVGGAVVTVKTF